MKTCKTCRHWSDRSGVTESRCALMGTTQGMVRQDNIGGPSARCLSGNAWFWTPADFGCNRWERRVKR